MASGGSAGEAAPPPALTVSGLEAGYGPLKILFGVDITVGLHEQVVVFGPNGAGKSTLIKAIAGLVPVSAGLVSLSGRPITARPPEWLARHGVAYVPQVANVFATMTVRENLEIGAAVLPRDRRKARIAAMEAVFPVLADRRSQRAGTLSGGERQMLSLARALVPEPSLLLLDEPSAGVAPKLTADIFERIQGLRRLGVSVLMVEQNARAALAHADRGIVLEAGRVRLEGRARDLLARDDIADLYLGGA